MPKHLLTFQTVEELKEAIKDGSIKDVFIIKSGGLFIALTSKEQ